MKYKYKVMTNTMHWNKEVGFTRVGEATYFDTPEEAFKVVDDNPYSQVMVVKPAPQYVIQTSYAGTYVYNKFGFSPLLTLYSKLARKFDEYTEAVAFAKECGLKSNDFTIEEID